MNIDTEYKKAILLLETMVFNYHGLDDGEKAFLKKTAEEMDALDELQWALDFVETDPTTAFNRSKAYLSEYVSDKTKDEKLSLLQTAWEATLKKGHITEIEATAILKLSKEWNIESDFIKKIRK